MTNSNPSIDVGHCVCNYEESAIQSHANYTYSGVKILQGKISQLNNASPVGLENCRSGYFIKCYQRGTDGMARGSADYVTYLVFGFVCLGLLIAVAYLYRKVKKLEGKIKETEH